jgi:hypothetical protein
MPVIQAIAVGHQSIKLRANERRLKMDVARRRLTQYFQILLNPIGYKITPHNKVRKEDKRLID